MPKQYVKPICPEFIVPVSNDDEGCRYISLALRLLQIANNPNKINETCNATILYTQASRCLSRAISHIPFHIALEY
jgi:hypothetical protein